MILPIYVYGSGVLRKEAAAVEKDHAGLAELVQNMFETMHHADGVGLAAPQVGLPLQLFVVDASAFAEDDPSLADFRRVFINSEILSFEGDNVSFDEGCLSLPGINEKVMRPEGIRIRYYDEFFNAHEEEFHGIVARIVQHEFDHTQGLVFTDRVGKLRKQMLQSKLKGMANGKAKASYPIKVG